jgi:DNA-binding beta-propeller fold protein YncE
MSRTLQGALAISFCFAAATSSGRAAANDSDGSTVVRSIQLPGAPPSGGVAMDYIAYERGQKRVWVPAGNTGSVDVIDLKTGAVSRIEGFPTAEVERNGRKRTVGPSSATVGESVVYVGNRADGTVCAVAVDSLKKVGCAKLSAMPDAVAFVSATKEVWVTTPSDSSITVLDASKPTAPTFRAKITLEGQPEGFTVDNRRRVVYTNLEDKDRTLAIDVKTRKVAHTWVPSCGEGGPKGLALDGSLNLLFVACPDLVKVLDAGHDGKELSKIETGPGVDDIAYLEQRRELYVGAARAAKLTVAGVGPHGVLKLVRSVATVAGARNAVVTEQGAAYLTDSRGGKVLVVPPAAPQ